MGRGRTTGRSLSLLVGGSLIGSLLAAVPAAADDRETEAAAGVEWGPCPEGPGLSTLECATVAVPLDYGDPDGARIEIMVSRLAGTAPDRRRGVLLLNPGGPGGSGLATPAELVDFGLPASVLDSYDLIGMDPRGVGHSSPVSCGFTDDDGYWGGIAFYAVDDAAVEAQAVIAEAVADQCAENDTDGLLPHMSTVNTARDMDRVRAALGEEKISYLGYSYGSALGAAYTSLFPERSDRIVLDSVVGDTFVGYGSSRTAGPGAEDTFPDFAAWAAEHDDSYGLGDSPERVRETYFEIAGRLDEEPVAGLDGGLFRYATFIGLYGAQLYPRTAQLWQSLREADEPGARRLLDEHGPFGAVAADRGDGEGTAAEPAPADNLWSANLAVTCIDTDWPEDLDVYRRTVARDRQKYPLYGAAAANIRPCAYWHHEPSERPVRITGEGPRNVLIVQDLRDPITPHRNGVALNERFGERSRLVSVDASGHGVVYVHGQNTCAWNVTTRYLVKGVFPRGDVSCGPSAASGPGPDGGRHGERDEALFRWWNLV
ncbi:MULTISPECIES: alpha/beta fold hydrolase [unclassified Nocardiopsis]|uniref:alpha/beta fold hydrolase n=1 Tax=Nocardiopsis TaxID=2013 RepID=UPI00387AAD1C